MGWWWSRLRTTPKVFIATFLVTVIWLSVDKARDFHVYWQAGVALRTGGWTSVYQITNLTPFKYHPMFAILFAPFGLLSESAARIAWALLNGLMLLDAQRRWRDRWGLDSVAIGMGFLCVGHALFWQYHFGNVTFAMLWLWTVALTTPAAWREASCYAVLIVLKPFWVALVVPWLLYRRFKATGRVIVMLVAWSIVPIMFGVSGFLTAYQRWFATFQDPLHAHNFPKTDNQSWYGFLYRHIDALGGHLTALWLLGSAAVGVLWLWQWRRAIGKPPPADVRWMMELSLMPFILWTAPLNWIHHQILLWPLLALAWQMGRRAWSARAAWVASFVLLTVLSESIIGRAPTLHVLALGLPLLVFPMLTWWASAERLKLDKLWTRNRAPVRWAVQDSNL
jgi:Glycosyltransferase family 87